MFKQLAFSICFLLLSNVLCSQVLVTSKRDSTTNLKVRKITVVSGEVMIVYPIPKAFSTRIYAIIDFGEEKEYLINSRTFLAETYEVKKKNKSKIKSRTMTFNSEAHLLNYLLKNDFEFVGGPRTCFIVKKK